MITKSFDSNKIDDFPELSHLILSVTDVLASHVGTPSCIEIKLPFKAKCIDLGIAAQDIIKHSDHLFRLQLTKFMSIEPYFSL